jgi:hypothetical protein
MSRKELGSPLWALFVTVILAFPVFVWGTDLNWQLGRVTFYAFFPLLGLLAFSLMWTQIIAVSLKPYLEKYAVPVDEFLKRTGIFVLLLIIFHPLLLDVAQYQLGAGLPTQSLYSYEPPMLRVFITYALIAWFIFILSEVSFRMQKVAWIRRLNPVVEYVNYAAFFLIFWHSIHIGSNLQHGWVRDVWWFYGVSALFLLIFMVSRKSKLYAKRNNT